MVIDAPNPHAMWLMHAADRSLPPERMLAAFATHLREQGFPLLRLGVLVRTSQPLVFAWGGLDWRDRSAPETFEMPYEVLRAEELRLSRTPRFLAGKVAFAAASIRAHARTSRSSRILHGAGPPITPRCRCNSRTGRSTF